MSEPTQPAPVRRWRVVGAWIALGAVLVTTLALVDGQDTGDTRPFWMLFLPALCGIIGGVLAGMEGRTGLSVWTILLGVMAVPMLFMILAFIYGP